MRPASVSTLLEILVVGRAFGKRVVAVDFGFQPFLRFWAAAVARAIYVPQREFQPFLRFWAEVRAV